ncbi:MAG: hypothetical protein Q4D55_08175, partial [Eubacteriales bacterium]|nr:hypothetical protein [Eubacteriales bacterium]
MELTKFRVQIIMKKVFSGSGSGAVQTFGVSAAGGSGVRNRLPSALRAWRLLRFQTAEKPGREKKAKRKIELGREESRKEKRT